MHNQMLGTSGVNTPLVDFHMIFDIDFSILLLIYKKYLDKNIFDLEWFKQRNSGKELVKACIEREEINPLYLPAKENIDKKILDDLYNQFLTDKNALEELKECLFITEYFYVIPNWLTTGDINVTILFHNDWEEEILKMFNNTKDIQRIKDSNVYFKNYNQFYLKYACLTDQYKIPNNLQDISIIAEEKTIYFANYKFNRDKDLSDGSYLSNIVSNNYTDLIGTGYNVIRFTSLYSMEEVYEEEIKALDKKYQEMEEGNE